MKPKLLKRTAIGITALAIVAAVGSLFYRDRNMNMFDRLKDDVAQAGYTEKKTNINGSTIAYLEGPDNGPALMLIHGQSTDKYHYAPALPKLAASFHVFAVDCYGHGQSSHDPAKYSNVAIGMDLLMFIPKVIGESVLVTGHSSGGLIAVWLAAYGEKTVRGVLFEDPPFFTTSLPRAKTTWNWVDLATSSHEFVERGKTDWTLHHAENARIWKFFGDSKQKFIDQARQYHKKYPSEPLKWDWLPAGMNEGFRAIPEFDPHFGDVFYRGEWEKGFDLETALSRISVPVIYQKSEAEIGEDGILQGATSDKEAKMALNLLNNAKFYTDRTSHNWHWAKPREFVSRILELKEMAGMASISKE